MTYKSALPPPSEFRHFERLTVEGSDWYLVPAWGYLDTIELRLERLAPNMDAGQRYRLFVQLIGPDGPEPLSVSMICRNVL